MDKTPFTVVVVLFAIVFVPDVASVRLLKIVVELIDCDVPLKITVLVLGVKVPLLVQVPLTVNVFIPDIVKLAPELIVMLLHTAAALITG